MQDDNKNILGLGEAVQIPEPVQNDYLHYFQTVTEYKDERENNYYEPWVSLTEENDSVAFNRTKEEEKRKWLETPLTFKAISGGTLSWFRSPNQTGVEWVEKSIRLKKNGGEWTTLTTSTVGVNYPVATGDIIEVVGDNDAYTAFKEPETPGSAATYIHSNFRGTANLRLEAYGNIMSLIDGENFADIKDLPSYGTFAGLFSGCTFLLSSEDKPLLFPATGLTDNCYRTMFSDCVNLKRAPELPSTVLKPDCYAYMFQRCSGLEEVAKWGDRKEIEEWAPFCCCCMYNKSTSITVVPENYFNGPTEVFERSFDEMFSGCTSIMSVPKLPAETLAHQCYRAMYWGCTSLVSVPTDLVPATTLGNGCYMSMFENCSSLRVPPALPAEEVINMSAYTYMFKNCTSMVYAPQLPCSGTIGNVAYMQMFQGCTSLTSAPLLPGTTVGTSGYAQMFALCTSLTGMAQMNATTNLTAANCLNMYSGCTSLTKVYDLTGATLVDNCYNGMFRGCTSLVTPPALSTANTVSTACYRNMFYGCTSLTSAPELPAVYLANYAYSNMFNGCTSLTDVGSIDNIVPRTGCCSYMFANCTSLSATPNVTYVSTCMSAFTGMYEGCTGITDAYLVSPGLATHCYSRMFYGCTNLTAITVEFEEEPGDLYTLDWVSGVSATGVFTKPSTACWHLVGTNGIPEGWTFNQQYGVEIEEDILNSPSASTELTMYIHSNGTWSATAPSWATLSQTTGESGITKITVTTLLNDTSAYREGNIVVSSQNNEATASCRICQSDDTDWEDMPMTFEVLSAGTIYWKNVGDSTGGLANPKSIQYSKNGGDKVSITSTLAGVPIECETGDKIAIYHSTPGTNFHYNCFSGDTNAKFCVYGNLKSLIYGENFKTGTAGWAANYKFYGLFRDCSSLTTHQHKQLVIACHSASTYAMQLMFAGTGIENGYNFIIDANSVYLSTSYLQNTFSYCYHLKALPQLHVVSGAGSVYSNIFAYDKGLKCANGFVCDMEPYSTYGYYRAFYSNDKLKYARITFDNTQARGAQYIDMFNSCVNLRIGPEIIDIPTPMANNTCQYMFQYCFNLKSSPVLAAKTVTAQAYNSMFRYCASLQKVTCLMNPGTKQNYWLSDVPSGGVFVKDSGTTYERSVHGIPTNWTIEDYAGS